MANNLFVSYDLITPGKNYPKVTAAIEALGAWAKVNYSLYYLHTNYTEKQVADLVRKAMDANDKLIVIKASDAYWHNLPTEVAQYMQNHWNR